ncbi:MAG TPA: hypothetical protein VFB96_06900 [Pirellulaceae bacterium]|nr:hypothetical protein [Pirellulaceae bacterium]
MKFPWNSGTGDPPSRRQRRFALEQLESRDCPAAGLDPLLATESSDPSADQPLTVDSTTAEGEDPGIMLAPVPSLYDPVNDPLQSVLTDGEVEILLARAAAASASEDAIISIVDRNGRILGVRTEQDVVTALGGDVNKLVFAIDGAVAKARTAAFFASDGAPLTSRTIRNLSQSTITQREVESNPTVPNPLDPANNNPFDPAQPISQTFGPGFVAPIGVGGHFPQGIRHTPPVDLFGIEHQSRDSLIHPGPDGVKGTADDIPLASRFNVDPSFVPAGQELFAPESYGIVSGMLPQAQSRGIATLPGGIPIYKFVGGKLTLVGGIGVFFAGPDGFATFEQNFVHASLRPNGRPQPNELRLNAPKVLEAEWIAFAAVGGIRFNNHLIKGSRYGNGKVGDLSGIAPLAGVGLPFGRIDLVGITLEVFGPNPNARNRLRGFETLIVKGRQVGQGDPLSGDNQVVDPLAVNPTLIDGLDVPDGWLVTPHASPSGSSSLTAADVETIITQGIAEAELVRAAIRLPKGTRTRMVFGVADRDGNVLGLFRMPDATVFSIDVAVAKARNTAYYANPALLQDADKVDDDLLLFSGAVTAQQLARAGARIDGVNNHSPDLFKSARTSVKYDPLTGLAFSNRTFRFLAEPRFPSGVDRSLPPIFSSLYAAGVNRKTAENISADPSLAPDASNFTTVFGYDAFHIGTNFHNTNEPANQNGVVFFPGSTPLYVGANLQGGFGVSGDGVDQDDVVTFAGQRGFAPPDHLKADRVFYRGTRLPFQKFNRNPLG